MALAEQTFLFFMKCPDLKNLLSLSLELIISSDDRTGLNIFHRRILKCRELLFSESILLATPSNFSKTEIIAVMPKREFYSPVFQKRLNKMGLKAVKIGEVSPILLQECLQYTVTAKLAPQWNNVRDLLVQGRDFLMVSDPLRAIKLGIFVNGEEITLSITPKCIKMPHFKVETFSKLYEFSSKVISIQENCHVLPSYKRGKAISLSKSIFAKSMFKNYAEIKKHWKNMYGYRLPEMPEDEVWYLNVVFYVPFSSTYTYPSFCVRPFGMTEIFRVDPQRTLHSFIGDFCKKVDNICQEKCRILDHRAAFPSLRLHLAETVAEGTRPRPGTTYTAVQNAPYRSSESVRRCSLISADRESARKTACVQSTKSGNNFFPVRRIGKDIDGASENIRNIEDNNTENDNALFHHGSHRMLEKVLSHAREKIDAMKSAPIKTVAEFPNCQNDRNEANDKSDYSEAAANANQLHPLPPKNSPESKTKRAPDFSRLTAERCSPNHDALQTSPVSEKRQPQAKFAPKFLAKKQRQVVQRQVVDPSVKRLKYAPEFRKNKMADKSEKLLDRISDGMSLQAPNIDPDLNGNGSVAEESAPADISIGHSRGKESPFVTQVPKGRNTSSKKQVRSKQKISEDEKAKASKSAKPAQRRSRKTVKA